DRAREARDRSIHVLELARIGQLLAQSRRQEALRAIGIDAARRQHAPQDLWHREPLSERETQAIISEPLPPTPCRQRALDAEKPSPALSHRPPKATPVSAQTPRNGSCVGNCAAPRSPARCRSWSASPWSW